LLCAFRRCLKTLKVRRSRAIGSNLDTGGPVE
jgi:hypothetical protein